MRDPLLPNETRPRRHANTTPHSPPPAARFTPWTAPDNRSTSRPSPAPRARRCSGSTSSPSCRPQIEQLRDRQPQRASGVPSAQRASEASLRQRNRSLLDENQRLREENASLKSELAMAYGQQRHTRGA